jgi:hypothetical protein
MEKSFVLTFGFDVDEFGIDSSEAFGERHQIIGLWLFGSGLRRPFEPDDQGRPVLPSRKRRVGHGG